ncbi:hypothetical protein [Vibrio caribbeanicus]|uniref:hypothetical protein n=1 Tax=Vibrio caribbeanicus TaxID=701175 RepID=UPI0030D97556
MKKITSIALCISFALSHQSASADVTINPPQLNRSHEHHFKADQHLSDRAAGLFNRVLNHIPPEQLESLATRYLEQVERIESSNLDYDESRVQSQAVNQEVGKAIKDYLKHQKVSNPRFFLSSGQVEGWCLRTADLSCSGAINPFGELAHLDSETSLVGGFSLVVGKPNLSATVETTLNTEPGQTYTLSFDFSGDFKRYPGNSYTFQPVSAVINIGGESVLITKSHPLVEEEFWVRGLQGYVDAPWDNGTHGRHWEKVELQFMASHSQTRLSFTNLSQTQEHAQTTPLMISNVMVYDDVTADKGIQPGKVAAIATAGVGLVGLAGTIWYWAKKGRLSNVFESLGYGSTTVGPGTQAMGLTQAFDDMYEIVQGSGGHDALLNYLTYPTQEYGTGYFSKAVSAADLNTMAEMGFKDLDSGLRANQVAFEDGATYLTKMVSSSAVVDEQTVIKFDSQESAANFARQLDSYLLREEEAIAGIAEHVSSISVMVGGSEANAVVAEHESVIVLHSAAEFEYGEAGMMGIGEFMARFALVNEFDQYIVDSLPFTYNSTSLAGIGWSSIIDDVNDTAAEAIHGAYQAGMTAEEFSAAAMEALEVAGVVALL